MGGRLTHGRVAAAALVAISVIVVAVVVGVLGRAWWQGNGGSYAPPRVLMHTTVTPTNSLFGQILTARAQVVVDPRRVDPRTVDLTANLRPFHIRSESRRTHPGLGRAVVVEFEYQLQCISSPCVPRGHQGGATTVVQLHAALATFRAHDGRSRTVRAGWPPFGVQSRLTPDELAFSTPSLGSDRTPPPVTWAISPNTLGALALGAAVLLALGAAGL
ncbi:MAG: hypothetical protein H0X39_19205, partial [Actinobacteria bacterium]|nr:hypothetical protein [Actinomycetota bacterium]